jgi:hypothetical protein
MTLHDEICKEIVAELALEGIEVHKDIVEAIQRSQAEFTTIEMDKANIEDGGKAIRWRYFGTFQVKPKRLEFLRLRFLKKETL